MNLIKFDNYTPPAPTTYTVKYSDVNGTSTQVEDGTTYTERVRTDVPEISVGWTNVLYADAYAILTAVKEPDINVTYMFGEELTNKMTAADRSLQLKLVQDDEGEKQFWDISFTLKG